MDSKQEKGGSAARKKSVELSRPMAAGILALVLAVAGAGGYGLASIGGGAAEPEPAAVAGQETEPERDENPEAVSPGTQEAAHEHTWEAVLELRDVPAVTHIEHHDAVVGTETTYETVCNECGAIVTGATRSHTDETGHEGFTRNVPIENEVVESAAWDETVVDEPATVELVHTADRCSGCGITRDVDDESVETLPADGQG